MVPSEASLGRRVEQWSSAQASMTLAQQRLKEFDAKYEAGGGMPRGCSFSREAARDFQGDRSKNEMSQKIVITCHYYSIDIYIYIIVLIYIYI